MLIRKLVVVGLVGLVCSAASFATAEDADAPGSISAINGVSFSDPNEAGSDRFSFNLGSAEGPRFENLGATPRPPSDNTRRDYELSVVARAGAGFDVAFAQRGGLGFDDNGDIARETRASELRLGRGLNNIRRDQPSATSKWYIFAASEDEALIWQPGARNDFGGSSSGLALQDRAEVGNMQAGITYEIYGIQASLAYVEREIKVRAGGRGFSQDESFTGVTLTMRR